MKRAHSFLKDHWPRLLISAAILAVFLGNGGFRSLVGNFLELRRLRGEITQLSSRQARLSERLKLISAGGSSLERLARVQLGYVKKGEIEYRFPPPPPAAP
ncbi:MAG: septum formation initiator family protein [Elusimicrobia bacterium]|nr:septum formation initiator family protein [Elusimicrobiota bacterium]MDE2314481.1 septum formation initiator family protein [Elusimicrobiota bacterium]